MVKTTRMLALGACLACMQVAASTAADALAGLGYGGSRGGAASAGSAQSHAGGGSGAGSGAPNGAAGSAQGARSVPSQGVNGSYVSQEMSGWARTHLHAPGASASAQAQFSAPTDGPGMQAAPAAAAIGNTVGAYASQRARQAMPAFRGGLLGAIAGERDRN